MAGYSSSGGANDGAAAKDFEKSILLDFQDSLMQARPRDVLKFAVRYFGDCRQSADAGVAHALHVLPFFVFEKEQFLRAACTIFCAYLRSSRSATSGAGGGLAVGVKDYLDGEAVLEVLDRIALESLRLRVKIVDEVRPAQS